MKNTHSDQRCRHFFRGHCSFGNKCKFSHMESMTNVRVVTSTAPTKARPIIAVKSTQPISPTKTRYIAAKTKLNVEPTECKISVIVPVYIEKDDLPWVPKWKIYPLVTDITKKKKLCSTLIELRNGRHSFYNYVKINLYTNDSENFHMIPDNSGKSINLSLFLYWISFDILNAKNSGDFSQVVRKFYLLYCENIEFIKKLIFCKNVINKDIGSIIQKFFLFESQPITGLAIDIETETGLLCSPIRQVQNLYFKYN